MKGSRGEEAFEHRSRCLNARTQMRTVHGASVIVMGILPAVWAIVEVSWTPKLLTDSHGPVGLRGCNGV